MSILAVLEQCIHSLQIGFAINVVQHNSAAAAEVADTVWEVRAAILRCTLQRMSVAVVAAAVGNSRRTQSKFSQLPFLRLIFDRVCNTGYGAV